MIRKVTVEDVGLYTCRQFRSGQQQGEDSAVHLSVINMTEHQDADKVTLTCSVLTDEHCSHTVEWLYEGNKNDLTDMKRSQHSCSATVTFTTSDFNQKLKHPELFKCKVTDSYTKKVQLFPFSPQSSGGDATTTRSILTTAQTTTMVTTTKQESITSTWETRNTWTSVKKTTSAVNIWTRTEGNKTQMDGNMEHNDEDEDDGTVNYENVGEPSVSVRLH
ncbi:uncharacterized protein LOC123966757 [Micropterus dolomieu]|uniref:uncharacterized protein LOC123966757 n=1 Tax=Micropterus dolomieu TaxID=147949 RepID=UPI001E8E02F3|nr:uncharacterized protein LOC123966757 [Micropterus dolomieu]